MGDPSCVNLNKRSLDELLGDDGNNGEPIYFKADPGQHRLFSNLFNVPEWAYQAEKFKKGSFIREFLDYYKDNEMPKETYIRIMTKAMGKENTTQHKHYIHSSVHPELIASGVIAKACSMFAKTRGGLQRNRRS